MLAADFVIDSRGDLWIGLGKRTTHTVRHVAILDYCGWGSWVEIRIRLVATIAPEAVSSLGGVANEKLHLKRTYPTQAKIRLEWGTHHL